jgi:hypothetical protein
MKYFKVNGFNSSVFETYSSALYAANNDPERIKQYNADGVVVNGDDMEVVANIKAKKKAKKSATEATTTEATTESNNLI